MAGTGLSNTELGAWGEQVAAQALIAHGYQVVERNWRCTAGEIDIVAQDENVWVFVEVKTRSGDEFGTPEEAVTPAKQAHLFAASTAYLSDHELQDVQWRIDVVALTLAQSGRVQRLDLHRDAVRFNG